MPGSKVPIVWPPAALDTARSAQTFQGPGDTGTDRSKGEERKDDSEEFHEDAPAVDESEEPPGTPARTAQRRRAQDDAEEPDDGGRDDRGLPRADADAGKDELPGSEEADGEGWSDELAQPSTSAHRRVVEVREGGGEEPRRALPVGASPTPRPTPAPMSTQSRTPVATIPTSKPALRPMPCTSVDEDEGKLLEDDVVRRVAAVIGVSEMLRAWSIPPSSVRSLSVQS